MTPGELAPADEDLDEIHHAAWCALRHWRETIKPFQLTGFRFVENDMASLGISLTEPFDAGRAAAKVRGAAALAKSTAALDETLREIAEDAAYWRAWSEDRMDAVASGW